MNTLERYFSGHQCGYWCIELGDNEPVLLEMRTLGIPDYWSRAVLDAIWDKCRVGKVCSNYRDIEFTDRDFPATLGDTRGDFRFTRCMDDTRFSLRYKDGRWICRKLLE